MNPQRCTCARPWCDRPACHPHRGKAFIVRLAVCGLLTPAVAAWLIRILGWKGA